MRTYKMTISYDGGRYLGWDRIATNDNTIQYILEYSISRLMGRRIQVEGAASTGAGAHARGQIASVHLDKNYDIRKFKELINRTLPDDIRVLEVEAADEDFSAKKSARGFKYEYYIDNREKPDVFSRRYCYHYPGKLDIELMKKAAKKMCGTKDFSSFTTAESCENPICTLLGVKIMHSGEKLRITYYGTEFLEGMVELMTGTLLEVGSGKRELEKIPVVIAAQDRDAAGVTVPSKGVFLRTVYY